MSLSPDDSEPASRQVASAIRGEISAGDLAPGAKIPSVRKLSERFGVAVMTAQSAVEILRSEGLIYTSPGRGSFVRSGPPSDQASTGSPEFIEITKHLGTLQAAVTDLARRVAQLEEAADQQSS
ncbi:winged helix-turn-helix transcriptional regulator [Mesorhizobium sp. B2-3-3]|uniref:GntR family transcriptional regulator n=1 Tax=Streptomyces TaxID=1883 RepID=UPI0011727038|nr:winged helix-turn-helix domain-containing protein [Streptomyces sp. WI03-5b]MDX2620527.1 winged helix-turn-helix domain-containing protein [Streptomyces sp. WI03-5b]TPN24139.1 winged helix-turn-helix transcriptional regulator [Mesorhizobium sp. B2-3-3]